MARQVDPEEPSKPDKAWQVDPDAAVLVGAGAAPDRSALWIVLLRRLTNVSSTWLVWKNVESALEGVGDIDSAAAMSDWPLVEEQFFRWAHEFDLEPAIACRHIPGGLNLVAMPSWSKSFLELSVKENKIFRGSTLFVLADLLELAEMDARGFRRLRKGSEGLFKLVLNGSRWGGRENPDGLKRKNVAELLAIDSQGMRQAAKLFGPARGAVLALASRVISGEWNRRAMLFVEICALGRGIEHPITLARRAWFRTATTRRCPIVRSLLFDERRIPTDRRAWLDEVARNHRTLIP